MSSHNLLDQTTTDAAQAAVSEPESPPEFPAVWDATMVREFRSCPFAFYLSHIRHKRSVAVSTDLHAGAAYAKGMEVMRRAFYDQKLPADEALGHGILALVKAYGDHVPHELHVKTLERMIGALEYYTHSWNPEFDPLRPLETTAGHAIEFSFAYPLPYCVHPDSGDPILYAGRFDMLGQIDNMLFVVDDKTTTRLGDSWARQWRLRSQFTGYCWGANNWLKSLNSDLRVEHALIRGVSILKSKYEHAETITPRDNFLIDRWLQQTQRDISRAASLWKEGYWDRNFDESCAKYRGCSFLDVCTSLDEEAWLESYATRKWDPLYREQVDD